MLNDMEDLHRLLNISHLRLLSDDQVNVHIRMDEVTVSAPAHCSFDSHQAVFLGPLEYCLRVQRLGFAWVVLIGLDPTDVLTPPKAPLPQTLKWLE